MSGSDLPRCPYCNIQLLQPGTICPGCLRELPQPAAPAVPAGPASPVPLGALAPPTPPVPVAPMPATAPSEAAGVQVDVDELLRDTLAQRVAGESLEQALARVAQSRYGVQGGPICQAVLQMVQAWAGLKQCSLEQAAEEIGRGEGQLQLNAAGTGPAISGRTVVWRSTTTTTTCEPVPPNAAEFLRETLHEAAKAGRGRTGCSVGLLLAAWGLLRR